MNCINTKKWKEQEIITKSVLEVRDININKYIYIYIYIYSVYIIIYIHYCKSLNRSLGIYFLTE